MPENLKSQFIYLRPDLGTRVFHFHQMHDVAAVMGITLPHRNQSDGAPPPELSDEAQEHVERFFDWDIMHSTPEFV
jgi:hypothetical protein